MNRAQAFEAIQNERTAQDVVWRKDRPIEAQYKFTAPHIILLEEQVKKLRTDWYNSVDESELTKRLVNVAALAVRALEEITATK